MDGPHDEVKISCLEKDFLMNDLIGETTVKVYQILNKFGDDRWLALYKLGRKTMNLFLEVTYNETVVPQPI